MARHRSSVFTVVREEVDYYEHKGETVKLYLFSAIIGTYLTLQRAEEIAGKSAQEFKDAGVPDGVYRFSTQIGTYYEE